MTSQWQVCPLCAGSGKHGIFSGCSNTAAGEDPCPVCAGARILATPGGGKSAAESTLVADINLLISRLNQREPTVDYRNAQRCLTEAQHFVKQAERRGRSA